MKALLFIFFIFLSSCFSANAMDVDVSPSMFGEKTKKGDFFFGFSTGVNLFAPYRDSGDESIKTIGNVSSAFLGYAIKDWIIMAGYEHSVLPIEYHGDFDGLSRSNNLMQHPEFFVEVNYYITRKYFWQPYLIYSMSMGWQNNNGSFVSEGVANHYNFGSGVNFDINKKFSINLNSIFSVIKHQTMHAELYMSFGLDFNHKISDNVVIVYAIEYQTARLNERTCTHAEKILPVEIDLHGHSALLFEIGVLFL